MRLSEARKPAMLAVSARRILAVGVTCDAVRWRRSL